MGTYKSVVDFEEGRGWLLANDYAEECNHCGRRWQSDVNRPYDHLSNGPYVIVNSRTSMFVGTSDKLITWGRPTVSRSTVVRKRA